MTKRRLPIGIQTFRHLREQDCYYVDKTAYLRRLIDEGRYYFLSRPRRFGKSLFLDTLKELFEGAEGLFEGLAIHGRWDWSVRHPVLRLSFGSGTFTAPGALETHVLEQLAAAERRASAAAGPATARGRFAALLEALHARDGRPVVVLVDEYDRPSWTPWRPRRSPEPTATTCAASTRSSRTAARTSGSRSSPA